MRSNMPAVAGSDSQLVLVTATIELASVPRQRVVPRTETVSLSNSPSQFLNIGCIHFPLPCAVHAKPNQEPLCEQSERSLNLRWEKKNPMPEQRCPGIGSNRVGSILVIAFSV